MTDEQRAALLSALKEVHDRVHGLYPRGDAAAEDFGVMLRNQLLVVDLAVHLAQEVVRTSEPDERQVAERTANLLYAVRLVAPEYPLERAAELLAASAQAQAEEQQGE